METNEEDLGKVYPLGDQASAVLDALRLSLAESGAEEILRIRRARYRAFRIKVRSSSVPRPVKRSSKARTSLPAEAWPRPTSAATLRQNSSKRSVIHHALPARARAAPDAVEPNPRAQGHSNIPATSPCSVEGRVRRTERGEVLFTEYGCPGRPYCRYPASRP